MWPALSERLKTPGVEGTPSLLRVSYGEVNRTRFEDQTAKLIMIIGLWILNRVVW
jgi:hypothetical protein